MTKTFKFLAGACAALSLSSGAAVAGGVAPAVEAPIMVEETSDSFGVVRLFLTGIVPTHTLDEGDTCSEPNGFEFCANTHGIGGYAGFYAPMSNGWSIVGDLMLEYHGSTNTDDFGQNEMEYGALGLHFINETGATPWGLFVLGGHALAAEDNDDAPDFMGVGFETMYGDYFVQVGAVGTHDNSGGVDGLDSLFFLRGGRDMAIWNGELRTSAAVGFGDFEEGEDDHDGGHWLQLAAAYHSALSANSSWYIGYQGDYVSVEGPPTERSFVNTFELGVEFTFGGGSAGSARLPFETPDLRAPISYAGEFN